MRSGTGNQMLWVRTRLEIAVRTKRTATHSCPADWPSRRDADGGELRRLWPARSVPIWLGSYE
ncbi:MAG: hypothetical protein PCFJNLEI_02210 [Verrucomicrobiae bacterium]|nr:hypothetical protein [Verrucomicrobiae bacterium]